MLSFYLSNEGLFETIALTEAWKISVKADWSSQHFSQNCQIVRFVYQSSLELFLQYSTSIDTFSHEKLHSAHTEVRADLLRSLFSTSVIVGTREAMSDENRPRITPNYLRQNNVVVKD